MLRKPDMCKHAQRWDGRGQGPGCHNRKASRGVSVKRERDSNTDCVLPFGSSPDARRCAVPLHKGRGRQREGMSREVTQA